MFGGRCGVARTQCYTEWKEVKTKREHYVLFYLYESIEQAKLDQW